MAFPTTWVSAAAGSSAGSTGATNPYLLARLGLALSAPLGCLCGLTALPLSVSVPRCGLSSAAGPGLLIIFSYPPLSPRAQVSRLLGGFLPPPLPRLSCPSTSSPLEVTPKVTLPRGNFSTLRVSMPLGNSTPPPHSLAIPS